MLGDHKPGHEMDDTAASAAHDRLEAIIQRIKAAGAAISKDETVPLVEEFNNEAVETGDRRVVEFNINKTDFQITRDSKYVRTAGGGHNKHLEKIARPMITTSLKKKPENTAQWLGVDIDEMF